MRRSCASQVGRRPGGGERDREGVSQGKEASASGRE